MPENRLKSRLLPFLSINEPRCRAILRRGFVLFARIAAFCTTVIVKQPSSDNTPYEKIGDEVRLLADLVPFEIPSSWEWCRVGDLFSNMSGLAYKKGALAIKTDKMVRVLRGRNIGEEKFYFNVHWIIEIIEKALYFNP